MNSTRFHTIGIKLWRHAGGISTRVEHPLGTVAYACSKHLMVPTMLANFLCSHRVLNFASVRRPTLVQLRWLPDQQPLRVDGGALRGRWRGPVSTQCCCVAASSTQSGAGEVGNTSNTAHTASPHEVLPTLRSDGAAGGPSRELAIALTRCFRAV